MFVAALNLNERSTDSVSNSYSYAPALPNAVTRMYLQTHLPRDGPVTTVHVLDRHTLFSPHHAVSTSLARASVG
jgi:hypothetical protein